MMFSALLGNPVIHSVSPRLFAEYAADAGLEYAHLKLQVPTAQDLPAYGDALRVLGCVGFNVTMPYKLDITRHVSDLAPSARAAGAVNTVAAGDGSWVGHNTDGTGALRAIESRGRPLRGTDKVTILGAGGAARAICSSLYETTQSIRVIARNATSAAALADHICAGDRERITTPAPDEGALARALAESDVIVNATPVGMQPNANARVVPEQLWAEVRSEWSDVVVLDAIFNPLDTLFLQDAASVGAVTVDGLWMMVYQAMEAFALWTGHRADDETCNRAHSVVASSFS